MVRKPKRRGLALPPEMQSALSALDLLPETPTTKETVKMANVTNEGVRHVVATVEDVFSRIGQTADTRMPLDKQNKSPAAVEYFLAETLVRLAKTRFEAAKAAAEEAGVFGEEADYKEGESVLTYNSKDLIVSVKRGKGGTLIDRDLLKAALAKRHNKATVEAIITEGSKPRKGTTTITTAMK